MIPEHLINKAAQAILDGNALQLAREDGLPVRYWALTDLPKDDADMFRREAQAVLEAVAADIWDEGFEAGEFYEHNYGNESGTDYPDNPYRASEKH